MRAVQDRIVTVRESARPGDVEETDSGLYVVKQKEHHWDAHMRLRVVSVGPLVREDIKEGDLVITRGMAGADITVEHEPYIVIHEADAVAVLR